jgi:hypothetical protein
LTVLAVVGSIFRLGIEALFTNQYRKNRQQNGNDQRPTTNTTYWTAHFVTPGNIGTGCLNMPFGEPMLWDRVGANIAEL